MQDADKIERLKEQARLSNKQKPYFSLAAAAELFSCSTRSLLRAADKNKLKLSRPFGPGGRIVIKHEDLEMFFQRGYAQEPDRSRGARLAECRKEHQRLKSEINEVREALIAAEIRENDLLFRLRKGSLGKRFKNKAVKSRKTLNVND